ncbi:MAG: polyprenyl synthetase family protein [Alphaproteobacteria bacterium]|nr:polyprenyl synthetase family protein [Alphaproteobacteria bacterium]
MDRFALILGDFARQFDRQFAAFLTATRPECPELSKAIDYACFNGGKRIRPFLVLESARLCEAPASGDFLAAAIEMVHCYSLIHDDLPAMDDSDLRRGRPTLHKQYGEATAILAGDSLLTASFEIIAKSSPLAPPVTVEIIRALAQAAGGQGMCGGQSLDILGTATTPAEIGRMQRLKTGALIEFSACAGAIMVADCGERRVALQTYAEALGLAFQIADDILDATGDSAVTGKTSGQDARDGKVNFVSLYGLAEARLQAEQLVAQAQSSLAGFGKAAERLKGLADYAIQRVH